MKVTQNSILTLTEFLSVYQSELRAGKFWGVLYNLNEVMGEALPDIGIFEA
jgi:hypothetical protein